MTMMIVIYALQFTNVKSSLAENQLLKTHEKHDNFNFPSCFLASNFHSHGQNQLLEFNLFSILRTCLSGHSLKVVGNDVFPFHATAMFKEQHIEQCKVAFCILFFRV